MAIVTIKEIADALGVTKQAAQKRAEKEAWKYSGDYRRQYDLTTLPQDVRDAVDGASLKVQLEKAGEGLAVYADEKKLRLSPAQLNDPNTWKMVHVYRVLRDSAAYSKGGAGRMARAEALCQQYGVGLSTLWRWEKAVEGWHVATSTPRIEIAGDFIEIPKTRKFDEQAVRWGLAKYGQNIRRGVKWAYEQLRIEAQEQGWAIGDYTNFTRIIDKIPDLVWDACRAGMTRVERDWVPKVTRAWLSAPAYSVLCGDQNVDDFYAIDQTTGELVILNYYLWMDCTSRAWTGLWPSFGPYNKYTFAYSLLMACRLGLPDSVYHDNGGPETSKNSVALLDGLSKFVQIGSYEDFRERFSDMDVPGFAEEIEGVDRRLSRPGIPWHKPIEPQMNVLKRYRLDREVPGYRQRQTDAWENKVVDSDLKKEVKRGQIWTIERHLEEHLAILAHHNAKEMRANEGGGTKIVPGDILKAGLASQPNRTRADDLTLDLLFLPRAERTPLQSTVRAKFPDGTRHYQAMELSRLKKGERVTVHADPFDPDKPAIISIDGEFYCLAERKKDIDPISREGLSDSIRYQRGMLKQWRSEIEKLVGLSVGDRGLVRIGKATKLAKKADEAEKDRRALKDDRQRAEDKIIQLSERRG